MIMIQNYFDNVKRILGSLISNARAREGWGKGIYLFSFLKIIGSPAKWAWRAGKKKRGSGGNEFLPARLVWGWESVFTIPASAGRQNNLFIVKEYTESRTAKEPGRPIFNEMLGEIGKGNASGILAWNPDRLARNSIDGGRVIYLVDTGKITSLKFPTFWFEATPQGKFMLSVAFGQAKYYTDNLRENILRGIRQKIRRGELSAKAPLGYFNEPRLRTIEPDKKTFKKVKQCLEAFATGNYTLSQIRDKMFSLGLVGPKTGKKMSLSSVEHILKNPFYYGHFLYRGELHKGSHKPMISLKISKRELRN